LVCRRYFFTLLAWKNGYCEPLERERWRQHKSNLKSIYFDVYKTKKANYNNVPGGIVLDQWIALVNNWMTLKAQYMAKVGIIISL
jgi:hypothetical protein